MQNDHFLHTCLFFTANRLSRAVTKIAEEEFAATGLTPMYGYLLRLVLGCPGISQKQLAEKLAISASTLTRFVDKLELKQLLTRQAHGKTVRVNPTAKAMAMQPALKQASRQLHDRLAIILGDVRASDISMMLEDASGRISEVYSFAGKG